jgi:hypothetical protein
MVRVSRRTFLRVVATTQMARHVRGKTYLVQGTGDGVASWVANRRMLGSGKAGEESNNGGLGEHVDGDGYYGINA